MAGVLKFRNLVLGNEIISSRSEYKRLMLTGYLAVLAVVVSCLYAVLDITSNVFYAIPAYAVMFFIPIASIILMRLKFYETAKILLVLSLNLVVFWSAVHDPFETGVFLFFIPAGIGSFAIFSSEKYKTGFFLAGFSTILFLIAFLTDIKFAEASRPTELYIKISFVSNYFISLTISVLAVNFLIRLNKASESELIQKEIIANQKNAELQKVNDELDRFVYSVSHDLRSPLSSILGLTNLAKHAKSPEEVDEILSMINGRIHAQDHFIREIIDYARNARTEVSPEPVRLLELVDEITESLKFNPNAEKIAFRKKIDPDVILSIDRIRLSIILNNLISNAIKYHDLSKAEMFIEIGYRKESHVLYVEDNGAGIKPEHQKKIFNMFYRGSDRSSGSGLGLFITREAVNKLQGKIEVQSTEGQGSTFTVHLPESTHR